MVKRVNDALKTAERGNGGAVGEIEDDRPWRTYWNQYGEGHRFPADAAQLMILMEQGWALYKPRSTVTKPKSQRMRDGSVFDLGIATQEVSESEWARIKSSPDERRGRSLGPTATYYTAQGGELPNLPADPESMAQYLLAGLTLDPPAKAPGKVLQLREA